MIRALEPQPLTAEAFQIFGDVIDTHHDDVVTINEGNTLRFNDLARLDLAESGGRPSINIFRSTPLPFPITIQTMERHPKSSQAFYPISGLPYLVVVAPPGEFDAAKICVFQANGHQGVNYHRGTWHHYSLATTDVSDFLVVDRIATDNNCDEVTLPVESQLQITSGL